MTGQARFRSSREGRMTGPALFFNEPRQLAYPKHQRGGTDDDTPIFPRKRNDVKHRPAEGDNQVLPHEDERRHEEEALAVLQIGKRRAPVHERLRIEHIPELEHDEEGEETGKVLR